jgi:choline dehydrogenase-like flavoprotein
MFLKTNKKELKQNRFETQHAIVIGGSMAGLLAARVLSEHFERVTILERDHLIDEVEPRKGVPQGRHVHTLLAGGAALLGAYFPDLFAALARDGAVPLSTSEIRRYQLGVRVAPVPGPLKHCGKAGPFLNSMYGPLSRPGPMCRSWMDARSRA